MNNTESFEKHYAQKTGAILEFGDPYLRLPTLSFDGYMQEMNQSFTLSYDAEEVFGRNDAIMSYRNTKRSISLSWNVPSIDLYDAKLNQLKTRILIRMIYPRYENLISEEIKEALFKKYKTFQPPLIHGHGNDSFVRYWQFKTYEDEYVVKAQNFPKLQTNANKDRFWATKHKGRRHTQTMVENPMIFIRYANLISTASGFPLLGYLDGLNAKPILDEGYFTECAGEVINPATKQKVKVAAGTYPKLYTISCNFNVIHHDPLGWTDDGLPLSNLFNF